MRVIVLLAIALIVLTSICYAGDMCECTDRAGVTCLSMKVNVCPAGDFQLIRDGCTGVGTQYIWVEARCEYGPVAGVPPTDFWLNSCSTSLNLFLCSTSLTADSATGANGRTTFTGRLKAGGCNVPSGSLTGSGVFLVVQGRAVLSQPQCLVVLCLPIDILSPDLAGAGGPPDGHVGIQDLTVFGTTFNCIYPGPYPPGKAYNACCDYTHDGTTVNVSDFGAFGTHWQHKGF